MVAIPDPASTIVGGAILATLGYIGGSTIMDNITGVNKIRI